MTVSFKLAVLAATTFSLVSACAVSGAPPVARSALLAAPVPVTTPSAAAADVYGTEARPSLTTDVFVERLVAEVDDSRRRRGQIPLLRDGRLDRVAVDVARSTDGARAPQPEAVAFLLSYYGLVEPEPSLLFVHGDDGAEPTATAALRGQIEQVATAAWRRVGVGVQRGAGKWSAVLVFQEKNFDLDSVPRRIPSSGHAEIAGRIRSGLHSPEVLFTSPRGDVEHLATSSQREAFSARFVCNRGDGAYQMEISAVDNRGPRVLANFPVYCGIAPPTTFAAVEPAVVGSADPAQVEAQLLEQLDRDRKAHGLSALVHDPRLAQIARRYSQEMAENGQVAHISRRTGSVVDRVAAAKISPTPTLLAENVGSALSAVDAERGFMASPGHRDNILNRAVTHVGVGVAIGREPGGVSFYFTQVFAGFGQ